MGFGRVNSILIMLQRREEPIDVDFQIAMLPVSSGPGGVIRTALGLLANCRVL